MGNIVDRIKHYIDSKGISVRKFEESVGFSNGAFSRQYKKGKTIGVDKLESILEVYTDINPEWLLSGEGTMLSEVTYPLSMGGNMVKEGPAIYGNIENLPVPIPLYEDGVDAGFFAEEPIASSYIIVPGIPKCDGAVKIYSETMSPLIKNGDTVAFRIVNKFPDNVLWGEIHLVAFAWGEERHLSIGYLKKGETPGEIILSGYEKHIADKLIPMEFIRSVALVRANISYSVLA